MAFILSECHASNFTHYFWFSINEYKIRFYFHILYWDFIQTSISCSNNQISIRKLPQCRNPLWKKFIIRSQSFKNCSFNWDFKNISCCSPTINIFIILIDNSTSKYSFDISEIHIKTFNLNEDICTFLLALSIVIIYIPSVKIAINFSSEFLKYFKVWTVLCSPNGDPYKDLPV